eukprot:316051-Chlamydomonas_euryale.AAC.1
MRAGRCCRRFQREARHVVDAKRVEPRAHVSGHRRPVGDQQEHVARLADGHVGAKVCDQVALRERGLAL